LDHSHDEQIQPQAFANILPFKILEGHQYQGFTTGSPYKETYLSIPTRAVMPQLRLLTQRISE